MEREDAKSIHGSHCYTGLEMADIGWSISNSIFSWSISNFFHCCGKNTYTCNLREKGFLLVTVLGTVCHGREGMATDVAGNCSQGIHSQ